MNGNELLTTVDGWVKIFAAAGTAAIAILVPWWGHRREERNYQQAKAVSPGSAINQAALGAAYVTIEATEKALALLGRAALAAEGIQAMMKADHESEERDRQIGEAVDRRVEEILKNADRRGTRSE